jgi:hypothetical protein
MKSDRQPIEAAMQSLFSTMFSNAPMLSTLIWIGGGGLGLVVLIVIIVLILR